MSDVDRRRWTAWVRDPLAVLLVVGAALVVTGVAALALGWRGVAGTLDVPLQLPYLVSGGLGGTALIALGCGLWNLHASRREAAREMARLQALTDDAARLLEVVELRCRREAASA